MRSVHFYFLRAVHTINQQNERRYSRHMTERKVSRNKKLALARYIREENHGNRLKIRQREKILYGTDTQPPLYDRNGKRESEAYQETPEAEERGIAARPQGTFRYRMILAVFLFAGFLLCDTGSGSVGGYTTDEIQGMITEDTFHLYDGGENAVMDSLAGLLDFAR